jgi:hypothetical protein
MASSEWSVVSESARSLFAEPIAYVAGRELVQKG